MRNINMAVYHCSADKEGTFNGKDVDYLDRVAKERGFRKVSYHIIILPDGEIQYGRKFNEIGAHAKGFNTDSLGIVYIGGLDKDGNPKDTRTPAQRNALYAIKEWLDWMFPGMEHVGHRDLSVDLDGDGVISPDEWMKQCPCFNVEWL